MQVSILGKALSEDMLQTLQLSIPFFIERIVAGFPSPAQDYIEQTLDLNELCIKHPTATFFVRAKGESMKDAGISSGDILVVDRALTVCHDDIVIAEVDGEFTVKRLQLKPDTRLCACNPKYKDIILAEGMTLNVFGVVTNIIKPVRRKS